MSTATPEAPKKNRTVLDQHGQSYELTGRIGEGGQGIVCTTNYPNVLVKVARYHTKRTPQIIPIQKNNTHPKNRACASLPVCFF